GHLTGLLGPTLSQRSGARRLTAPRQEGGHDGDGQQMRRSHRWMHHDTCPRPIRQEGFSPGAGHPDGGLRHRSGSDSRSDGDHAVTRATRPLAVVAVIAVLMAVVALASRPAAGTVTPTVGPAVTRTMLDSVFYLLLSLGLAVIAWLGWRLLRPSRRTLRVVRAPLAEVERALDDALVDAATEPDPRRAVLAVWARIERLLAEHDAGRRPSEAPFEYAT